ncbi:hypothetical protein BIZ37_27595 [Photobacterium sp. BZF1]|uniref:hypothetical protein n=1 Tax=Photobacterium sp. BZF1 TaxID=1904457 RepID=UPI001653D4A5|nr:hypothetical protein [Photobacterium sp. BZF1]MBC7006327.1 hypothetical protein [Photobacterium sp. BZF1]
MTNPIIWIICILFAHLVGIYNREVKGRSYVEAVTASMVGAILGLALLAPVLVFVFYALLPNKKRRIK